LTIRPDDESDPFKVPNRVSAETAQSDTVKNAISKPEACAKKGKPEWHQDSVSSSPESTCADE
jgi:hypothetical protein